MRFSTSLSFMLAYIVIANPLPSWDLSQADMLIGIENKDFIDPEQPNIDFWNIGSHLPVDSPQNWISQLLSDGLSKPKRPSPLIPKPAPFSVCEDEAYMGFCCNDAKPATTLVRIDCQPCKPSLIDQLNFFLHWTNPYPSISRRSYKKHM